MERPPSPPLASRRLLTAGMALLVIAFTWWEVTRPEVVGALFTIEDGVVDDYRIPLRTPLLVEDDSDLARVLEVMPLVYGERIRAVDFRSDFLLLATSEVCTSYLGRPLVVVSGDRWWVGSRSQQLDGRNLYRTCEETIVDLHVFEIDRRHLDAFHDVALARG
ncbi:MAG: hypothetical protein AAGD35_02695 [Actinomycetota bacterium]